MHDRHTDAAQQNYDCSQCHSGVASGTEVTANITSTILHVNYSKDVVFANTTAVKGTDLTASFDSGTKACASTYCHGDYTGGLNSTPTWTSAASGACGTCHISTPTSGAHTKHTAGTAGNYSYGCAKCHNDGIGVGAAHHTISGWKVEGTTSITFDSQADMGPGIAAAFNSGTKACGNTYCHGDFSGGKNASPLWTGGAVACNSCHDIAPLKSLYGAHDKHTDSGQKNYDCSVCHNTFASGNETSAVYSSAATHANFVKNVSFNNSIADRAMGAAASFNTSTKDCSNTYCHGDFTGGLNKTANWSGQTGGACGDCHSTTNPGTGSHTKHVAGTVGNYTYTCNNCHNDITKHADGTLGDIKFDTNADKGPGVVATYNTGTHACANTYCHGDFTGGKNASPVWGSGAVTCNTCHDAAPLNSTYGVHDRHTDSSQQNYDCSVCHSGIATGIEATASIVSTILHANYSKDVVYTNAVADRGIGTLASFNPTNKQCAGTYCHGDYTGGLNAVPVWDNAASGACGTCHSASNPATQAHGKHISGTAGNYSYACAKCHNDGSGVGATHHAISGWLVDGTSGVTFDSQADQGPGTVATYNSGTKVCAGTYCHGDFTGGKTANSADWTKTGAGSGGACSECHDIAPLTSAYGSHDKHTDTGEKNYNCSVCHSGVASGTEAGATISSTSLHVNFSNDVVFNTAVTDNGTGSTVTSFNSTTKQCTGSYCHGDFTGGITTNVPDWDAKSGGSCGDCHNAAAPVTGSHTKHVGGGANYSYACTVCHSVSTHVNGVQGDVSFDTKNPNGTYNPGTKVCAGSYCHGSTLAADWGTMDYTGSAKNASPTWGNAATGACGTCHDAAAGTLTTGKHDKHMGNNAVAGKYNYTCHKCHNDVISEGGVLSTSLHVNRSLNVKMDTVTNPSASPYNMTTNTCANTYCHGNFNGGIASTVADWDLTGAGSGGACGECHLLAPSKISFGVHDKHTDASGYNYDCSDCHSGIVSGKEGAAISLVSISSHANFAVNVAFSAARADKPGSLGAAYNTVSFECTNTYCHGDFNGGNGGNIPVWNNTAAAACGSCHDTAPQNLTDSGSHNVHTNSASYNYDCSYCHYTVAVGSEALPGSLAVQDNTKHVNFQNNVIFDAGSSDKSYGANTVADYTAGVCSNTYCHGDFDGGKRINTVTWGGSASCGTCHDNAPLNSTYGVHDKHTKPTASTGHIYDCSLCHNTVTAAGIDENSAFNESAFGATRFTEHADFNINVSFTGLADQAPATKANTAAGYTVGTKLCANTYCHGDFDEGLNASPSWLTASTGACGSCHGTAPSNTAYGVHDKHTKTIANSGYNYACQNCHNGTVTDATVKEGITFDSAIHLNGTARWGSHVDGNPNVSFTGLADQGPRTSAAYNTGTRTCSYTYCHGDFASTTNTTWLEGNAANTATWATGSIAACGTCHGVTTGNNSGVGIPNAKNVWIATSEGHVKHAGKSVAGDNTLSGYQYPCGFCHNGVYDAVLTDPATNSLGGAYETGTKTPNYTQHADGVRTPLAFYTSFTNTVTKTGDSNDANLQQVTCVSLYCHSDGWNTSRVLIDNSTNGETSANITWNSTTTCTSCHRNGTNAASRHVNTDENHYSQGDHSQTCQDCHQTVMESTTNTDIDHAGRRHVNRWKNIKFLHDTTSSYTPGGAYGNCSVNCHGKNHSDAGAGWDRWDSSASQIVDENP